MKIKKENSSQTYFEPEKLTSLKETSQAFRRFSKKVFLKDSEKESTHLLFAGIFFALYGCYQNLNVKYREQFLSNFLNTSLPIFQRVSQKLHWETLTEIGLREIVPDSVCNSSFSPPLSNPFLQTVIIDDTTKNLNICFYSPWSKLKKQEFIAFFPINNFTKQKDYSRVDSLVKASQNNGKSSLAKWSSLSAREIPDELKILSKKNSYPLFNSKNENLSPFETFEKDSKNHILSWYSDDIPFKLESFSTAKKNNFLNKEEHNSEFAQKNSKSTNLSNKLNPRAFNSENTEINNEEDFVKGESLAFQWKVQNGIINSEIANSFDLPPRRPCNKMQKVCSTKFEGFSSFSGEYLMPWKSLRTTKGNDFPHSPHLLPKMQSKALISKVFASEGTLFEPLETKFLNDSNLWRGIISKAFPTSSNDKINSNNPFSEEEFPKTQQIVFKGKKILFPSRLVSGFLWPDMIKSEIRSNFDMVGMKSFPGITGNSSSWLSVLVKRLKIQRFGTGIKKFILKSPEEIVNQVLLRQMRISLPANIALYPLNQKGGDFNSTSFLFNYKKVEFPVLEYAKALVADFFLEPNPSTIQDLKKGFNAKEKYEKPSKWFFVNWVKRGFSVLTFWRKCQKVAFYGHGLNRFGNNPQIFLVGKDFYGGKEWVQEMKGILANQQDSFFGEEKNLILKTEVEKEELELPTDLLLELEGDILPFGGFAEKDFQARFNEKGFFHMDDIFYDPDWIESPEPVLSLFQRIAIPELNVYEWYSFLQSQLEVYLTDLIYSQFNSHRKALNSPEQKQRNEKEEKEKPSLFKNFKLQLPTIAIEKAKSSDISASLTLFNSQPFSLEVFPFIIPPKETSSFNSLGKNLLSSSILGSSTQVSKYDSSKFFSHRNVTPFLCLKDLPANVQLSPNLSQQSCCTLMNGLRTPLEYKFNFEPWSGNSFAGLNNALTLFTGDYRKKSTSFEFSRRNFLRKYIAHKFNTSASFEQKWEPLTTASFRIFYKLLYILWIQQSLQTLYKGYGREILQSLVSILVALGFDVNQILEFLNLKETESGLRIIEKTKKRFDDIAGVDSLLPELGETVWFLKTKGNLPVLQTVTPPDCLAVDQSEFWDLKSRGKPPLPFLPKGTLLVGPPGTGKTFLVQAIAGEAGVPVVLQSASALMELDSNPSEALSKLFEKARNLAPCILFIDEVDTLGSSRENVLSDNIIFSAEPSLEIFSPKALAKTEMRSLGSSQRANSFSSSSFSSQETEKGKPSEEPSETPTQILQDYQKRVNTSKQQLAILMQFIVEMDGLKKLSGVVLMGATNRPGVLDPALVRPGRFEKTLTLELPNKEKRIAILQHYAKKIGLENSLQWNALGEITAGFTAADISSAMNQSALYLLLNVHAPTLDTLEAGIESISREKKQSPTFLSKDLKNLFYKNQKISSSLACAEKMETFFSKGLSIPSNIPDIEFHPIVASEQNQILNELDKEVEKMWNSIMVPLKSGNQISKDFASWMQPKDQYIIASLAYNESGKVVLPEIISSERKIAFLSLLYPEKERIRFYQNSFSRPFEVESDLLRFHAGKGSEAILLGTREADRKQKFFFLWKNLFHSLSFSKSEPGLQGMHQEAQGKLERQGISAFPLSMQRVMTNDKSLGEGRRKVSSETYHIVPKEIFTSTITSQDLSQVPLISNIAIQEEFLYSEDISIKNLLFLEKNRDHSEIKDSLLRSSLRYLSLKDKEHIERENNSEDNIPDYFYIQSYPGTKSYSEQGDLPFGNWYRMYLSDPEQGERNEEWVEAEKIYSPLQTLENILPLVFQNNNYFAATKRREETREGCCMVSDQKEKEEKEPEINFSLQPFLAIKKKRGISLATQKDIQIFIQDYIHQGLAANALNQSHNLLSKNREILDLTVDFSLRYQKIRSYELKPVFKNFINLSFKESTLIEKRIDTPIGKKSISFSWGFLSQKPDPRLIRLEKIK